MDCRDFEAWLDAGRPAATEGEARAHANACRACGALSAAETEMDGALETRLAPAFPDFTEHVLARVAAEPRATAPPPIDPELLLPWWVQVLREPAALLGLALGAIYAASAPLLVPAARGSGSALLEILPRLAGGLHAASLSPIALASFAVPLVAFAGWALYRLAHGAAARLSGVSP